MNAPMTITLRVDAAEHAELAARADRDKVTLSDYIRVRLGRPATAREGAGTTPAPPRSLRGQRVRRTGSRSVRPSP